MKINPLSFDIQNYELMKKRIDKLSKSTGKTTDDPSTLLAYTMWFLLNDMQQVSVRLNQIIDYINKKG